MGDDPGVLAMDDIMGDGVLGKLKMPLASAFGLLTTMLRTSLFRMTGSSEALIRCVNTVSLISLK
jgi:hypothetical protein